MNHTIALLPNNERLALLIQLFNLRDHYVRESNNASVLPMRLHYWYMAETVLAVITNDSLLTGEYIGSSHRPFSR